MSDEFHFNGEDDAKAEIRAAVHYLLKSAVGSDRGDIVREIERPTMLLHQPLVQLRRTSLLTPSLSLRVAGFCARLHCPALGSWVLINSRSI